MEARPPKRFAVVADGRSLMRDLLRYLLEQQGIDIASEASTGAAAVEAVAEHRPDVVILHEAAAMDPPDAIGRIRTSAPEATLVILTADRSSTLPTLTSAADAVVEEGSGLQDLAAVLAAGAGVTVSGWSPRPAPPSGPRGDRAQRWADRLQGAVAASILMLAVVLATSVALAPPEGLQAAYDSLETLAEELPEASLEQAVSLATTLISERAMLRAESVDVSGLDIDIAEMIAPILGSVSPEVARALRELLGDLLVVPSVTPSPDPSEGPTVTVTPATETPSPDPAEPSPAPTETPAPATEPSPTDAPSAMPPEEPSATPTETDTVSPTSSPTESPSPSPSESPSPSPSESPSLTESPTPSETATPTESPPVSESPTTGSGGRAKGGNGAILVVPPGLLVLLGSSGAARWLRRRRG